MNHGDNTKDPFPPPVLPILKLFVVHIIQLLSFCLVLPVSRFHKRFFFVSPFFFRIVIWNEVSVSANGNMNHHDERGNSLGSRDFHVFCHLHHRLENKIAIDHEFRRYDLQTKNSTSIAVLNKILN